MELETPAEVNQTRIISLAVKTKLILDSIDVWLLQQDTRVQTLVTAGLPMSTIRR